MPGLSPGTAGAKEAYGISVIRDDMSINIPPKAFARYNLKENDLVLLTTTRKGESGFGVINPDIAKNTIFQKIIEKISSVDQLFFEKSRAYALTRLHGKKIILNKELLHAFNLKAGDRLLVIKSTTVTMSYTLIETWKKKFESHGFFEAIENMKKLEEF